jgi:hypothetical protein
MRALLRPSTHTSIGLVLSVLRAFRDSSLAEDKTRIIKFGRQNWKRSEGEGNKSKNCNFLGFTYYGVKNRRGKWIMEHKTSKENLLCKLKGINE